MWVTGDFPVQPSRLIAAVKFLSCQVFLPLSYQVSDKPTHLQPLPCVSYRWGGCSTSLILSPSDAQSCCGPWLGTGTSLCFALILPQTCPQAWRHKFPGFSHLCVALLLSQPTPQSLQIFSTSSSILPPAPPFPCPIPQTTWQVLGSRQGPHVSPGSWEGGCVLLLCIPEPGQSLVI